jgi:hypothetical protein
MTERMCATGERVSTRACQLAVRAGFRSRARRDEQKVSEGADGMRETQSACLSECMAHAGSSAGGGREGRGGEGREGGKGELGEGKGELVW